MSLEGGPPPEVWIPVLQSVSGWCGGMVSGPRSGLETEMVSGVDLPLQAQQALFSPRGEKEHSGRLIGHLLWCLSSPAFRTGGMSRCSSGKASSRLPSRRVYTRQPVANWTSSYSVFSILIPQFLILWVYEINTHLTLTGENTYIHMYINMYVYTYTHRQLRQRSFNKLTHNN